MADTVLKRRRAKNKWILPASSSASTRAGLKESWFKTKSYNFPNRSSWTAFMCLQVDKLRLKYEAGLFNEVVVEHYESHTSQARFRCGEKKNLGAAKTRLCRECGLVINRGENSGYKIMVRCVSEHHVSETSILGKRRSQKQQHVQGLEYAHRSSLSIDVRPA